MVFRDGGGGHEDRLHARGEGARGRRTPLHGRARHGARGARSQQARPAAACATSAAARAGARDGGGLFVGSIRGDVNRGQNGWVYKVGRRAATAGAADPSGPFGRGRLRTGQRVTWFYCRLRDGGCQRTLELKLRAEAGAVVATVRGYDDEGHGVAGRGRDGQRRRGVGARPPRPARPACRCRRAPTG